MSEDPGRTSTADTEERDRARALRAAAGRPRLLSRVAEHLYWAGRSLERAEVTARLVRTHTELFLDLPRSVGLSWAPLLAVTGTQETFDDGHERVTEDDVVDFLLADNDNRGSVATSIEQVRENFRITRGLIPRRLWEVVNETQQWSRATASAGCARGGRLMWTEEVIRRCHTLAGSVAAVMTRDDSYAFLEIGKLVERADMTSRVIDVQAGIIMRSGDSLGPFEDLTWMSMLRSVGGEQMYRRQMGGVVTSADAVQFLLCEPAFPRSIEHCLIEISRWLLELPHQDPPMGAAGAVHRQLDSVDLDEIDPDGLHEFVDELQVGLDALHDRLVETYFGTPEPLATRP